MAVNQANAEDIAVQALAFLASDPELLPRFLALSGIEASAIRTAATQPGFMAGVLTFFLAHEPSLMALSQATGLAPQAIAGAARALPTGDDRWDHST